MLDIKFIREHPDLVRDGIRKKGAVDSVEEILNLDARRRDILQKGEALKNRRNVVSEEIGKLKTQRRRCKRCDDGNGVGQRARSNRSTMNFASSMNRCGN